MTVSGPDVSAAPAAESGAEPVEPAAARPRSWGPGPAWRALRRRWRRSLRLRTAVLAALLSILAGLVVAAFFVIPIAGMMWGTGLTLFDLLLGR